MKRIILFLAFVVLMATSCSRTYDFAYDRLSISPFFDCDDIGSYIQTTLTDVRVQINTTAKIVAEEYDEHARNIWSYENEYSDDLHEGNNATLYVPSKIKNGVISVFNSLDEKIFEVTVKNGEVYSLNLKNGESMICEFEGDFNSTSFDGIPSYFLICGVKKYYTDKDDFHYLQTEIEIERTSDDEVYRKKEKKFYPSGNIACLKIYKVVKDESSFTGYDDGKLVETTYYKEDGSEMTLSDRIFYDRGDYIVLKSDFSETSTKWDYPEYQGICYMVLFPSDNNKIGDGAFILSKRDDLKSFTIDRMFEYRIQDNMIDTYNYSHLGAFGLKRKSPKISSKTYAIREDDDSEILVSGTHYYWKQYSNGTKVTINMHIHDLPYNSVIDVKLRSRVNESITN